MESFDENVYKHSDKSSPALNKEKKTILLSSINDYKDMANNMLRLVSDSVFREELIRNSEIYCQSKWDSRKNMLMQAKTYHCVYRHFHQKTPLPNEVTEIISTFMGINALCALKTCCKASL